MLQNAFNFILARAKERTTYAGLLALLVGFGITIDGVLWEGITNVLLAVAGLVAIVTTEKKE